MHNTECFYLTKQNKTSCIKIWIFISKSPLPFTWLTRSLLDMLGQSCFRRRVPYLLKKRTLPWPLLSVYFRYHPHNAFILCGPFSYVIFRVQEFRWRWTLLRPCVATVTRLFDSNRTQRELLSDIQATRWRHACFSFFNSWLLYQLAGLFLVWRPE